MAAKTNKAIKNMSAPKLASDETWFRRVALAGSERARREDRAILSIDLFKKCWTKAACQSS
jgi:hypothetical protein